MLGAMALVVTLTGSAPLQAVGIHPSGRYYTDTAGNPVFLIGYYGWAAVPAGYFIDHPSQYADMITRGAPYGINYSRISLGVNRFTSTTNPPVYYGSPTPVPFLYVNGKADLSQWDPVFWNGLKAQCDLARANGVIVHIAFFDGVELRSQGGAAYGYNNSFWNPSNHTSSFYPTGDYSDWPGAFYRLNEFNSNTGIGYYQRRVIDKTLAETFGYDNVFYEVGNELLSADQNWYTAVVSYARSQTNKPVTQCSHAFRAGGIQGYADHVGDTAAEVKSHIAGFVATANGQYPTWIDPDGPALSNADIPANELRAAAWYSFTGGAACWGGFTVDYWLGGRGFWPDTVNAYKHLQDFLKQLNVQFAQMVPHPELVSNSSANSCLAYVGHEYVAYVRSDAGVTVDLTGLSGSLPYYLYDPKNDVYSSRQTVSGGGQRVFARPDGAADWVVYIGTGELSECPPISPPSPLGAQQTLGDGIEPGIATDAQGSIHVVYMNNGTIWYRQGDPDAVFDAPELIPSPTTGPAQFNAPHVVCDGSNTPHVVFSDAFYPTPGNCWYTNRIGGSWKAPVSAFPGVIVMYPRLALCGSYAFVAASTGTPEGTIARLSNLGGTPHVDLTTGTYLLAPYPVVNCAASRLFVVGRNSGNGHYLQEYNFNLATVSSGQKMTNGTPNKTAEPTAAIIDSSNVVHAIGNCGATGIDPETNSELWYNNTQRMGLGENAVLGLAGVPGSGWWGDNVYPHMVMDINGKIWLGFRDITTGEGKISSVSDAGFTEPIVFTPVITDPNNPIRRRWNCQVAPAPTGGVYVTWDYGNQCYFRPAGVFSLCDLAVSFDLGSPDVANCMTHPQGGDGDTTPDTIGGRSCRRNIDPSPPPAPGADYYFYFTVCDGFAYQGNRPELYIALDYYDSSGGSISLDYDSNTGNDIPAIYKNGGSITLTGSNTWKNAVFHVTDAYFGNRQNGGADFRFGNVGNWFYLDNVRVSVQQPLPPVIAEVTPDLQTAYPGVAYSQQLALTQNCPKSTWSMVQGPPGMYVCQSNDRVLGWTPAPSDLGDHTIVVQACNPIGCDTVSWIVRVLSSRDFDLDGDVDQEDFGFFQGCLSGSGAGYTSGCAPADLESDGDVDQADFSLFWPCMAGSEGLPGC